MFNGLSYEAYGHERSAAQTLQDSTWEVQEEASKQHQILI